jgi:ATP adenylyltransferase
MKRLWTPWRKEYITGEQPAGCLFCTKKQDPVEKDKENYILHRGPTCFVLLNLFPYTNGHLMIAPYQHVDSVELVDGDSLHEMSALTQASVATLKRALSPAGFNIGMNIGKVAGAGVPDHVHIHVVPRWQGDANFMSVLAETRLIPETLDETYEKLLPLLREEISRKASQ